MPCPCDLCTSQDATVHLTELAEDGVRREIHICRACIARLDLRLEFAPPPIASLLNARATDEPAAASPTCPVCGLMFAAYAQTNLFGCVACYDAFAGEVLELAKRYHGAERHVGRLADKLPDADDAAGKTKSRRQRSPSRAASRKALQAQLAEAITREQYERAAALRDQLAAFDAEAGPEA
jgi:protein arginine kinase activator